MKNVRACWASLLVGAVLFLLTLGMQSTFGQNLTTITGTVTDAGTGELIPGTNVVIKGSNNGTSTNKEGFFEIKAVSGAVLVFSFVGYDSKELVIGSQNSLAVSLSRSLANLDEVIVVGYGTQKKVNLTGALSSVDAKVIENRPVSNLANALQGTMAGLNVTRTGGQPGSENIQIQIRGATSANGNVNPLLLVDGVPTPMFILETINPNDIENVTVLKDAAASAIYGAQAAGGVMLVTTKKGKKGKASFSYSNLFSADWAMNVPQRLSLLEEAEYVNLASKNVGGSPQYSAWDLQQIRDGVEYVISSDTNRYIYFNQKNILKQVARDYAPMQTHNFSATGGTDNINYMVSMGYYNKKGFFRVGPDGLNRYNLRVNLGVKLTKHISFDTRLAYTIENQNSPSRTTDGTWSTSMLNQLYRFRQRYPLLTPEGRLNSDAGIEMYGVLLEGGYGKRDRNLLDGVFTLKIADLVKGLQLRAIYGGQNQRTDNEIFERTYQTWYRFTPGVLMNPTNSYNISRDQTANSNLQLLADYDLEIGRNHKFHLMGGYQWEDYRNTYVGAGATSLISNNLPALNLGNNTTKTNDQYIGTYANQSYFGRFNYNYADKYLFEATGRVDETSRLAPGSRSKFFPALSAGWNVHKEDWFTNAIPFVSELKIRGSWGQLGSSLSWIIGYYDYINMLNTGNRLVLGNPETRSTYFYQGSVPSANLTWETIETTNGGIDFGLFKNKLLISADYYVKYNRNMLTPKLLPSTYGVGSSKVNNGELKSWGWEIEMKYRDKVGDNLSYSLGLNLSDNKNKLISYSGQKVIWPGTVGILEGQALNTIWAYKTDGYFNSIQEVQDSWTFQDSRTGAGDVKYVDIDGDGRITAGRGTPENPGDLVNMGTSQPRYTFGFNGSAEWKGVDFSFFFQGVGKRTFYADGNAAMPMAATWIMPVKAHLDYWTPENPNATYPRPYIGGWHNFLPSDKWMLNGRYVRLKNLQVGYSFSSRIMQRVRLTRARIFFSGQDLFTLSGMGPFKKMFNPENSNGTGHDYPFFSSASMGVNLTF